MHPKISIFVVYYNSEKEGDLLLEHLKALKNLDYPDYEVILVDNASKDNTYKILSGFINGDNRFKLIRSEKNTYFNGGNNLAFRYSSNESKYFITVNPDAVPNSDMARNLVELMERDPNVGAAQGIIRTDKNRIDTGRFIADNGAVIRLHLVKDPYKESYVTYVTGAMMIIRADFPRKRGFIFREVPLLYFDSNVLGLELYANGYTVKYYPIETGYHKGRANTPIDLSDKFIITSMFLFLMKSNSKFKKFLPLFYYSNYIKEYVRKTLNKPLASPKKIKEAYVTAKKLANTLNMTIDIYTAPHIEVPYRYYMLDLFSAKVRQKIISDLEMYRQHVIIPQESIMHK
ncbi:glycosyltransferase [Stygiolobus caldivivus]|uniref:Glycosyltransferase 2-like domain-containing protein n=1 Tax=Stygiolobus caldivivus TaxID=2824673 RepID=A0A8D5U436_9CREN|nr:glycosyltransferase family 2 protein [Stygiolobus caldivivus]BCU69070.1 hypothetical protein KN1_03670 [Stygiolobus caldivivus]